MSLIDKPQDRLAVHHFVIHANDSVGEVDAKFIAELARYDHRLGHNFSRERVNLAGVDDLVVNAHYRPANEVETVGVVGQRQSEVVVSRYRSARIPSSLNAKIAYVKRFTAFVGQRFLEPQYHVYRAETVGQERLRVGSQ